MNDEEYAFFLAYGVENDEQLQLENIICGIQRQNMPDVKM
tara:strand:+ start:141 stop:260 length:120 start_codon:yes stop_codon:yes gene_type:complete